jgi:WD40 repeat protein
MLVCLFAERPGCIRVFDLNAKHLKYRLQHKSFSDINDISFNMSGTKFLTHSQMNENMYVWDAVTGCRLMEIFTPRLSNFRARFTNDVDADRIVSLDNSGQFHVWNADVGDKLSDFTGFKNSIDNTEHRKVANIAVATNHSWCIAFSNGVLGVWNYLTAERLFSYVLFEDAFSQECDFAFNTDDGSIIAVSHKDLRSWDIATGTLEFHGRGYGFVLAYNHTSETIFVTSSTDASQLYEISCTSGIVIKRARFENQVRWITSSSAPVAILL